MLDFGSGIPEKLDMAGEQFRLSCCRSGDTVKNQMHVIINIIPACGSEVTDTLYLKLEHNG